MNLDNIIYKECFLIRYNSSEFRDAKMRHYMELRKKLKDRNLIDFCNKVLDYIYTSRREEIIGGNYE